MSKRVAELSIQLKNAKSLSDLEGVLKDINSELKGIDVNSQAFADLSKTAQQADNQLKSIKDDLKGIGDAKALDSAAKLAGGLAASLSVATVAAGHFGDETAESINKTIKVAQELNVIVSSIKPIMEALSSGNRKAFGVFIDGFKSAGVGAKLFGSTTRAAITSTGIGVLVILLGTLIANWDSVTKAVVDFGNSIPFVKRIIDGIESLIEKVGSLSNLFNGLGAWIKAVFSSGVDSVDAFNAAIERGKAVESLEAQGKLIKEQNEDRERQIKLLEAQGQKEQEIFSIKKQSAKSELDNLQALKNLGTDLSEDQEKRIKDLQNELEILDVQSKKQLEAAKRAAWDKKNVEAQRLIDIADLELQVQQTNDEKVKTANQKLQDDLLAQFKAEKQWEQEYVDEGIAKEETAEAFSNERKLAILDEVNRVKQKKQEELNARIRDEEIKFLEENKNRTTEQDEVLTELRVEKFKEMMERITPFVNVGLQAVSQIGDAISQGIQRHLDQLQLQLQSLNSAYQESTELRKSYEAELATAQGAQRDELLASIDQERSKEKKLADDRKAIQNAQIAAQNQQQDIQWKNSLLNSVVQTALAVTEALPNIPLSIAVGILGGLESGIIASNKPQPIQGYFDGSYTKGLGFSDSSGHEVAGVVHANEYVVPERILSTAMGSNLVATLEAMRVGRPSYALGGPVEAPVLTASSSPGFSPENMKAIIESAKIFVSVQEIRDKQTNVDAIESRAAA